MACNRLVIKRTNTKHTHAHTSLPGSVRLNRREAHFSRILGGSDILLLSASPI